MYNYVSMSIPVFLRYIGIFTVYWYSYGMSVCWYKNFLLDIDTGMTKIPSFQFSCGILPSSKTYPAKELRGGSIKSKSHRRCNSGPMVGLALAI